MGIVLKPGTEIGFLTLLWTVRVPGAKNAYWECSCGCGKSIRMRSDKLKTNKLPSCGCLLREARKKSNIPLSNRVIYYRVFKPLFAKIKERDGSKCVLCESTDTLHVHHILRKSVYPQYHLYPENLVTLCSSCHFHKAHSGNTSKINLSLAEELLTHVFRKSDSFSMTPDEVSTLQSLYTTLLEKLSNVS